MKVSEKKEFVGEFYLPQDPRYKIPGVLKIGLNGDVRLEIFGNFRRHPLLENEWNVPLINGEVADVGLVTILDCHYRSLTLGSTLKQTPIVARCALCNLDAAYKNKDEIKFNAVRFSVEHLNRWLNSVGAKRFGDNLEEGVTIKYVLPENIIIKLDDGIEIWFAFSANSPFPHADEVKISQSAHIRLTSEQPQSLSYFIDLVGKINTFLCMALGKVVCIKDVVAPKDGRHSAVQIYYQSFIRNEKSQGWHFSDALCAFHDVETNFPATLNQWIEKYELTRPTYSLYLLCRMGEAGYVENMFLSLVQALENLHEATHDLYGCTKHKGLKQKLEKLIFTFKDLIADDRTTKWNDIIRDVVGIRNYLTHYSKTASNFKEKSENPMVVYSLYKKLEVIIQLHFLKQIGFSNQEIGHLMRTIAYELESEFSRPYQSK